MIDYVLGLKMLVFVGISRKSLQTYLFMKPYPLFTLNHLTVPVTLVAEKKSNTVKLQSREMIRSSGKS